MSNTRIQVRLPADTNELTKAAARELAVGLGTMIADRIEVRRDPQVAGNAVVVGDDRAAAAEFGEPSLVGDSFSVALGNERSVLVRGGSQRAVLHGVYSLMQRLGAQFPVGCAASFPRIEPSAIFRIEPVEVEPAFARRAFASDIMTWNYSFEDRLRLHLQHDAQFIPWMARHGINAFSYIRHTHDTRLRIDEIVPALSENGLESEYGGHVIPILLPRDLFETHPEYFPRGPDEQRRARGNLCVSSPAALEIVRRNAVEYVNRYPENRLLHLWGADVLGDAWCGCAECGGLSPQLQYMKLINAIADSIERSQVPLAYLAYHDTIGPDPKLRPRKNVWFEWAPRERCYSHTIDDPKCETNPHYWESLQRYIELFEGRGHIFEYYADAILFGGMGFATPALIAADLRAYHRAGLRSISNLTFGQFSTLAYPVNLTAFVRGTRSLNFSPAATRADVANHRHPRCGAEMTRAYGEIESASRMVLSYADVMRPPQDEELAASERPRLLEAAGAIRRAVEAVNTIKETAQSQLAKAERQLWDYSAQSLQGIGEYIQARAESGAQRKSAGEAAIEKIEAAIEYLRAIQVEQKGTWGAYDLEWIHQMWIDALREGLGMESR
jgi:hypothetical protein